jgi:glycosyltransferase involved in cell wall biosynthesis
VEPYRPDGESAANFRILWLSWRDIKNPDAGGAEVFTHEVMRRLARKGYEMTLFASHFSNAFKSEKIDDVNVIREGGKYTVYLKAKSYCKKHEHNYDLIIDEINTRPFLTPKFVKKPILALIFQLAREFWFHETHFPINYLGYYYLEGKWLSSYKDTPTITLSNSSKEDLQKTGLRNIFVIPPGISVNPLPEVKQKVSMPRVVFLGRLKKAKLPFHAIEAFALIKQEIPEAKMWIIGDGYLRKKLEKAKVNDIVFYGRAKNELKYELLSKAHLLLVPSIREGWNLAVTESNAMGTPVVAYDVPGLRDSVIDGETGILVKEKSPHNLAKAAIYLLKHKNLLSKYSSNALAFSRQFSWDKTAYEFEKIISKECIAK